MPIGDIVPEIAVLITAAVILLGASFVDQRRQWLGAPLALVGLAIEDMESVYDDGDGKP